MDQSNELDVFFMKVALEVARSALDVGEVPVGCVIVLREGGEGIAQKTFGEGRSRTTEGDSNNEKGGNQGIMGKISENERELYFAYKNSPSVILSHGANMVNITRDATRHAELIAMDRMLTQSKFSDQLCLPIPDNQKTEQAQKSRNWINVPCETSHWKNCFGWKFPCQSNPIYGSDILKKCDLYVTCEPCIMVCSMFVNFRILS